MYILWAVIPEDYFRSVGITFLPQRYWAIAVPIYFLTVLTIFAFFIYPGFGMCMTPHLDDLKTLRDAESQKRSTNGVHLASKEQVTTTCICRNKLNCSRDHYDRMRVQLSTKQYLH